MNFQGKAILVYLEEDNIARAYFRVQPLMTQDGPVGPMKAEYPDDGYLRIVPDKNEQHTFKERMRTMIGLCLVDLRIFPLEANKIRTNKNYAPARGENNQFIVYSDAVRSLPDDLIYQVVSENSLQSASTPFVYIRQGANIQGPFRRDDGQPAGEISKLPPDSTEIHSVTVNNQDLLFYWPRKAEPVAATPAPDQDAAAPVAEAPATPEPAPATASSDPAAPAVNAFEQIQAMNEQLSENANRLRDTAPSTPADFLPEQPAKPLTGTRLYQAPQRQVTPRRAHNQLMEAVEQQRYAAKCDGHFESRYEAPGATLSQSAELKEVNNPADTLKRALQNMGRTPDGQRQAVDVLLSQPGMRAMLSKSLSREANDLTLAAMQSQLQEMEAERLMTLMQLDDAKKSLAAVREEALGKLNLAEQRKLDELHIAQQKAQNTLDDLRKAIAPLHQEAEEAIAKLQGNLAAPNRLILPVVGQDIKREELISRTEEALKAAGFALESGDAETILTAYALCDDEITFYSDAEPDAILAIRAFAAALGVQAEDRGPMAEAVILPGGDAPVMLLGYQNHASPLLTCCLHEGAEDRKEGYYTPSFPCISLSPALDLLPGELPSFTPVTKACVKREMAVETPLSSDTQAVILSLRKAMASIRPLPLDNIRQMTRFIACTQNTLKGGVAEAIDRAASLYIAPYLQGIGKPLEDVRPLLAAMPRTLKLLKA